MIPILINILILVLELWSFQSVFKKGKWYVLAFYTQLSNLCAAIAAAVFLILGSNSMVSIAFRYTASCMLTLTFLVVVTILIPLGEKVVDILWKRHGFLYHLAAPVLSFVSYCFFEPHAPIGFILIPIGFTCLYGLIMILLNIAGKYEGPYPFLKVRKQSLLASVLWLTLIVAITGAISWLLIIL